MQVVDNSETTAASKQRSAHLEAIKTGKKRVRTQHEDGSEGIEGELPLTSMTACFSEKFALQLQQYGQAKSFHDAGEAAMMETLRDALDQLESTLYETIVAYYRDVLNAYKYCLPLHPDLTLVTQAIHRSKEVVALSSSSHRTSLLPQLAKWSEVAEALECLYRTHQQLQASVELLENGQIVKAAAVIHEANQCMMWFASESHSLHADIIETLGDEVIDRKAKLRTRLNDLYDAAMTFDVATTKAGEEATLTIKQRFIRKPSSCCLCRVTHAH